MNKNQVIALIGGGEFESGFEEIHLELLSKVQPEQKEHKILLFPTAASLDGLGVAQKWGMTGVNYFRNLGFDAELALVIDTESANSQDILNMIENASVVYLEGGLPQVFLTIMRGSKVWNMIFKAYNTGQISIFGASAGAMAIGEQTLVNENQKDYPPSVWSLGLNILRGKGIAPHFDTFSKEWKEKIIKNCPQSIELVAIDEQTAYVISQEKSYILGNGQVSFYKNGSLTNTMGTD